MEQFKSDRADLQLKIVLGRSKSTVSRKRERMIIDRYVQAERAKQEKQIQTEYNKWALKLEHQMVNLAKKSAEEAHDAFLQRNVQQERAISNTGYTKLVEQNNSYIKKDEQTMDSALALYKAHFHALILEHENLKSLVESFISHDKARGKKKVEVTTVLH